MQHALMQEQLLTGLLLLEVVSRTSMFGTEIHICGSVELYVFFQVVWLPPYILGVRSETVENAQSWVC